MAVKEDNKNAGTIRGKIVWGYAGIYGIIALIAALLILAMFYIIVYERIRDTAHNELKDVLVALPHDASGDELYEQLEDSMPGYVVRYDLYLGEETPDTYSESDSSEPSPSIGLEDSDRQYDDPEPDNYYSQENITEEDCDADQDLQYEEELPKIIAKYYSERNLNVRVGPSAGSGIIGTLNENELVSVTDMSGRYYQIIYEGRLAWVYGPYLTTFERRHVLSNAGVDKSYQSAFDDDQANGGLSNIKELNKLYLKVNGTAYQYNETYQYYYSVEAVIDMSRAVGNMAVGENFWDLIGIAVVLLAAFVIGLVIITIYGAYKTRKYLKPVEDITNLVSQINESSLSRRIDVESARYELKELVMTINSMLDRVYAGYAKQKIFVSDVSHELRTPISVVAGYANMLKRWARDDEAVFDESVDAIIEEADNMKYLVDNLLFLVRSDNNTVNYDMECFDLSELIHDVFKSSLLVDNNKHNITEDIADGICITGDRARIKQAARIFIENAVKYTPPMGNIKLSLKKEGENVVVTISDNGIGISKKDMTHIFKRFYRGDKSRNRQAGGYGLGLPIARSIINAHGGKIHLRSRENEGTIIDIIFNV